jgi:hypothetical protein
MFPCALCHFDTPLDHVELLAVDSRCVCLRCYCRETNRALVMPKALRKALIALLAEAAPV